MHRHLWVSDWQYPDSAAELTSSVIRSGHTFAAGYDLRTRETYESTIAKFDEVVGLKYLKGMHLNDSQGGGFNCRKDRHQNIGL